MKTNDEIVRTAIEYVGNPYWYGTYGQIADDVLFEAKKKQYPKQYTGGNYPADFGKRVFDCAGLVKYCRWARFPGDDPTYYKPQDLGAARLYSQASSIKGPIKTFDSVPGRLLFMEGSDGTMDHVGIYIGHGRAVEARNHSLGVQLTRITERPWTHWSQCDWFTCKVPQLPELERGDKGDDVKMMQALLLMDGFSVGEDGADGIFGKDTEAAVKRFQKWHDLYINGIWRTGEYWELASD